MPGPADLEMIQPMFTQACWHVGRQVTRVIQQASFPFISHDVATCVILTCDLICEHLAELPEDVFSL